MFKFLSGVFVGWTAARILPPPPSDKMPWQPPTVSELRTLAQHVARSLDAVKEFIEEDEDDQRADKTRFS